MKEFLKLRDHDSVFQTVKEQGGIGIPLFVNEDGRKTLDINEALAWMGQESVREEEMQMICKALKMEEELDCGRA